MTITIDTREPWPHPWALYFPADVRLIRGTLETGDLALAALPDGAVIERKTVADFLAAIGRERKRVRPGTKASASLRRVSDRCRRNAGRCAHRQSRPRPTG